MTTKEKVWLKAMNDVRDALELYQCRYFLDTGTLLGAIRDHQFIPWDNDIDIGVVDCVGTEKTIIQICEYMYNLGYNVTAAEHEISIFDKTEILNLGVKFYAREGDYYITSFGKICGSQIMHMLYMSISKNIIYKKGYGKYKIKSIISYLLRKLSVITPSFLIRKFDELSKVENRNISIPYKLLSEFSDYKFYNSLYKVPIDSAGYLVHRYGDNWITPNQKYNFITDDHSII